MQAESEYLGSSRAAGYFLMWFGLGQGLVLGSGLDAIHAIDAIKDRLPRLRFLFSFSFLFFLALQRQTP
jgi:hypothetical protein